MLAAIEARLDAEHQGVKDRIILAHCIAGFTGFAKPPELAPILASLDAARERIRNPPPPMTDDEIEAAWSAWVAVARQMNKER